MRKIAQVWMMSMGATALLLALMVLFVLALGGCGPGLDVGPGLDDTEAVRYHDCDVVVVADTTPLMAAYAPAVLAAMAAWAQDLPENVRVGIVGVEPVTTLDRPVPVMRTISDLTEARVATQALVGAQGLSTRRYVMDGIYAVSDSANVQALSYRRGGTKVMLVVAEGSPASRSQTAPVTAAEAALTAAANGFTVSVLTRGHGYDEVVTATGGSIYDIGASEDELVQALKEAVATCIDRG